MANKHVVIKKKTADALRTCRVVMLAKNPLMGYSDDNIILEALQYYERVHGVQNYGIAARKTNRRRRAGARKRPTISRREKRTTR